jgi:flagellar biosynthetic protein FliR
LAQIFGGSAGVDAQPAIGFVLVSAGLALAALLGLHVQVANYMMQSYEIVPPAVFIAPDVVLSLGLAEVTRAFSLGFQLSAPFLIASLIYNVTIGVINRAMPQLMVSFVGAPAITAGSILLLLLSAPILLALWAETFGTFMEAPFEAPR